MTLTIGDFPEIFEFFRKSRKTWLSREQCILNFLELIYNHLPNAYLYYVPTPFTCKYVSLREAKKENDVGQLNP